MLNVDVSKAPTKRPFTPRVDGMYNKFIELQEAIKVKSESIDLASIRGFAEPSNLYPVASQSCGSGCSQFALHL